LHPSYKIGDIEDFFTREGIDDDRSEEQDKPHDDQGSTENLGARGL
jgi:hypothetical protein